jgi:hypothetical protein
MVKTNCVATRASVRTARNDVPARNQLRKPDPKRPRLSSCIPMEATGDKLGFVSVSGVTRVRKTETSAVKSVQSPFHGTRPGQVPRVQEVAAVDRMVNLGKFALHFVNQCVQKFTLPCALVRGFGGVFQLLSTIYFSLGIALQFRLYYAPRTAFRPWNNPSLGTRFPAPLKKHSSYGYTAYLPPRRICVRGEWRSNAGKGSFFGKPKHWGKS